MVMHSPCNLSPPIINFMFKWHALSIRVQKVILFGQIFTTCDSNSARYSNAVIVFVVTVFWHIRYLARDFSGYHATGT